MLLDESPQFHTRAMHGGEPWRADSVLCAAARSVDLEGCAWLYVVFEKDPPYMWGSKVVKLLGGGRIARKDVSDEGVPTGMYKELRYEVLARHVFHNTIGRDSQSGYQVIRKCTLGAPEEVDKLIDIKHSPRGRRATEDERERKPMYLRELRERREKQKMMSSGKRWDENKARRIAASEYPPDPLLGNAIAQVKTTGAALPPFLPDGNKTWCCLLWERKEAGLEVTMEKEKITDERDVDNLELFMKRDFHMIEYQRRPFVQIIMGRLGFIKRSKNNERRAPSLVNVCSGHLRNIVMSMDSMAKATSCGAFPDRAIADGVADGEG